MNKMKVLIIGNGMVGHKAVELLAEQHSGAIQVIGKEPRPAYDRVHLSSFFSGKTADDLSLVSSRFYQRHHIDAVLDCSVKDIDRSGKIVISTDDQEYSYDKLILATGSFPFVPPIPGKDQSHCHVYRTIEDLLAIQASAQNSRVGVVVGGGLLGLEAAKALHDLGLQAHVVEFAPQLMAVQVDADGGQLLRSKIEALGVGVHTGKSTQEIVTGESCRYRMNFADQSFLETDMIVFSAGIRPEDNLARNADLNVGERGGIEINQFCQTSDPDIYAIGECALWSGRIFGLVAPGYEMASIAVNHILGQKDKHFNGTDMSTKLKLLGVDVASIGDAHGRTPDCCSLSWLDDETQVYKKVVLSQDRKKLLGAVLVGDTDDYGQWLQLTLNQLDLPEQPESLVLPESYRKKPVLNVAELPDDAQICKCNRVSKGDICNAIQSGCTDLSAITTATRAASTCGTCASLVTQILETEISPKRQDDFRQVVGSPG